MKLNCKFIVVALITCNLFHFFQVSHVEKNKSIWVLNVRRPHRAPASAAHAFNACHHACQLANGLACFSRSSHSRFTSSCHFPISPLSFALSFAAFLSGVSRLPRKQSHNYQSNSCLIKTLSIACNPFPHQRSGVRLLKLESSHRYCRLPSYAL